MHNPLGSSRRSPGCRDQRHTQPTTQLAKSAPSWQRREAGCSLSPTQGPREAGSAASPPLRIGLGLQKDPPPFSHRVEEVGLRAQREKPQTGLQVACPDAGVELLEAKAREAFRERLTPSPVLPQSAEATHKGAWKSRTFRALPPPAQGEPTLLRSLAVTLSSSRHGKR